MAKLSGVVVPIRVSRALEKIVGSNEDQAIVGKVLAKFRDRKGPYGYNAAPSRREALTA